jgi:hypothetical protein
VAKDPDFAFEDPAFRERDVFGVIKRPEKTGKTQTATDLFTLIIAAVEFRAGGRALPGLNRTNVEYSKEKDVLKWTAVTDDVTVWTTG